MPPADRHSTPITVRTDDELLEALDQFRREQADIPGRPEAIRRILKERLEGDGYLVPAD